MSARARWTLVAAAAAGSVSEWARRRRSARSAPAPPVAPDPPPPPMTTQSSPGEIADLQEAYGAEMAPSESRPSEDTADG